MAVGPARLGGRALPPGERCGGEGRCSRQRAGAPPAVRAGGGIRNAVRWERVQGLALRGGQRWRGAAAGGQDGGGGPGAAPSAGIWPRGRESAPVTLGAGQLSGKVRGSLLESYLNRWACQARGTPGAGLRCVRQPHSRLLGSPSAPAPAEAALSRCSASVPCL